jgi:hypothetical protein
MKMFLLVLLAAGGLRYGKPSSGVVVALRATDRAGADDAVPVAVVMRNVSGRKLTLRPTVEVVVSYPVPGDKGCARPASATRRIALRAAGGDEITIAAGDVWVEVADLQAVSAKAGGRLPSGFYKLQATVSAGQGGWSGAAGSERARLTIDGKVPAGMCAENPGWDAF